ncbi:MAG: sigma-54 dependent transcriptional regulator [Bdellovibrionota bacterium]
MNAPESRKKVLIVDDESNIRESLQMILSRTYEVSVADCGDRALEQLSATDSAETPAAQSEFTLPDLVLLDVMMPGIDGLGILEQIRTRYPALPVIMLTASKAVKTAVQAMKIGAIDYLNKPFDVDELLSLVHETLESGPIGRTSPSEIMTFEQKRPALPELNGDFGGLVGTHPVMTEIYHKISQIAERDTTILITGESGTGKELIAREIHKRSKRATGPFVAINCAAIPETLIESELFGHEKGAFTHAVEKRVGHFELADKGTLFLDEIGELSHAVQVKILRFLQEQEFYRIGRSKPIQVDVRIVTATNRSLETAIQEGRFRQDLYYRINVVALEMPPLRERREDVPALARYFVNRLSPLYGDRHPTILPDAMEVLTKYSWPGNVRELENVIESILALTTQSEIKVADLPARLKQSMNNKDLKSEVLDGHLPFEEAERAFETEIIMKALMKTNFVQTRAAELLGISRRILKYKMDKLGISEQPPGESRSN